jgi:hypothetical protein
MLLDDMRIQLKNGVLNFFFKLVYRHFKAATIVQLIAVANW